MLRITVSESASAAKHYFGQSLSRGDYYFEGQEIAGCWGGRAAERLGLAGEVTEEAFVNLLDNKRPDGERLTPRTVDNRRSGYDFTFDVPKSVSLLHSLEGDIRIVEAMRKAALETMKELEEEMQTRVRKNGADHERRTGEMIWADFTHFTSRPVTLTREAQEALLKFAPWASARRDLTGRINLPDPHLHLHVYAINATFDQVEQIWKAGDFMRQKRDGRYYQATYHTRLAGELQKLGYEIEPTAKAFEILGVPRSMIEVFSRRTKEVEDAAKALGIINPAMRAELGARTRQRKDPSLTMDELRALWKAIPKNEDCERLASIHGLAKASKYSRVKDDPCIAQQSVFHALNHELERVSEVSEKRLIATALNRGIGRVTIASTKKALFAERNVVSAQISGEQHITTIDVLREESSLMDRVRAGRGQVLPLSSGRYQFTEAISAYSVKDAKEQREAILHVMQSRDWIVGVIGRAGTGKTTLLKEIHAGLNRDGRDLLLCAPTAEAARGVLRGEGFAQADTVKRLLVDTEMQGRLRGAVLWVDEAGMIGNKDMLALLELAKKAGAARVVLAGDPTQIASVPRGDALRFLEENAGLSVARLEQIKRQRNPTLRSAVDALSRGDVAQGFNFLERSNSIHEAPTKEAHAQLARVYVEQRIRVARAGDSHGVLVVSPTHAEGEAVTKAIRQRLYETGQLKSEDRSFPRTVNLSLTHSEKSSPAAYEVGMLIQFRQNARGFKKGERVRLVDVQARKGLVQAINNEGRVVSIPLNQSSRFEVYRLEQIKLAVGDRIRVTQNAQEGKWRLNNGTVFQVSGFTPEGGIEVDNGRVLPAHFGHISHGYVVTADSAQSKTVDTVLAAVSSDSMAAADLRRFYVTISRARDRALVFTDDRAALLDAARRDSRRRSATDLIGSERAERLVKGLRRRGLGKSRRVETPAQNGRNHEREMEVELG